MNSFQKFIIELISNALFPSHKPICVPEGLDAKSLLYFSRIHQILPLIYYGLTTQKRQELLDISELFKEEVFKNIIYNHLQLHEIEAITTALEKNKIDHMLLKGSILKPLYPKSEMRTMGDIDILIKPEQYDAIRRIMQDLGYTESELYYEYEYKWFKGDVRIELHKTLVASENKDFYSYYYGGTKKEWQLEKNKLHTYKMSDEDAFIYIFIHFAKHFRKSGIGIRHILDLQIYLSAFHELDMEYIARQLEILQLDAFYDNVLYTLKTWFSDAPPSEKSSFITGRIFSSGAYGTGENMAIASLKSDETAGGRRKRSARWVRLFKIFFLPYGEMCIKYTFLKKAAFLTPVMWVVRGFSTITKNRQAISQAITEFSVSTSENIELYEKEMEFVGLK